MRDRVRPPQEMEETLDRLKTDGVFETKQKGMMFAAAIGYHLHSKEVDLAAIEQYGEGIRLDYFRTPDDEGFIDALAVATRQDLGVIAAESQSDRIDLFERYAYLGLKEMKRACYDDRPEDALSGILALLDRMNRSDAEDLPGMSDIL